MKKNAIVLTILSVFVLILAIFSLRFLLTSEDSWICVNGEWVRHGNPSAPKPEKPCGSTSSEKEEDFSAELLDFKLYPAPEEIIKIKFNKDMDEKTLNSQTVKLWAVGGSVGTQGEREDMSKLVNLIYEYDKTNHILTITSNDQIGGCASCTYEIELTDQIKDTKGDSFSSMLLKKNISNAAQEEKNITVSSPFKYEKVSLPISVTGSARVFENVVQVSLKDLDNTVLYESTANAQSPDIGQFGSFNDEIDFLLREPKGEDVILEVYSSSPKDGSKINLVSIPLKLSLGETTTVKLFFSNDKLDPKISCDKVFPVARIIPKTQSPAKRAVELLLQGPTWAENNDGYLSNINSGTILKSVNIKDGIAKADFDENLGKNVGGSCRVTAIRAQITETLKQFSTVEQAEISINGRTEDILQP